MTTFHYRAGDDDNVYEIPTRCRVCCSSQAYLGWARKDRSNHREADRRDHSIGDLDKAIAAGSFSDPSWRRRKIGQIAKHGAHADRMAEEFEHWGVVGGVADIKHGVALDLYIETVGVQQDPAGHAQLVETAEPTEDPEIVHGHVGPGLLQRRQQLALLWRLIGNLEPERGQTKGLIIGRFGKRQSRAHLVLKRRQANRFRGLVRTV